MCYTCPKYVTFAVLKCAVPLEVLTWEECSNHCNDIVIPHEMLIWRLILTSPFWLLMMKASHTVRLCRLFRVLFASWYFQISWGNRAYPGCRHLLGLAVLPEALATRCLPCFVHNVLHRQVLVRCSGHPSPSVRSRWDVGPLLTLAMA